MSAEVRDELLPEPEVEPPEGFEYEELVTLLEPLDDPDVPDEDLYDDPSPADECLSELDDLAAVDDVELADPVLDFIMELLLLLFNPLPPLILGLDGALH